MPVYRREFWVSGRDVDPSDRVRADALGLMLQESAAHHADLWGMSIPALMAQGRTWVLARTAMEFEGCRPGWKSNLEVETWSRGFRGHIAARDSVIRLLEAGKPGPVVARASSLWFVIDLATRRPVRLGEYENMDMAEPGLASGVETSSRLEAGPGATALPEVVLPVRASDLDLNGHVNNLRYIEWLYEAVPQATLASRRLKRLEVHYTGETHYPDTARIWTWAEGAEGDLEVYTHSVLRGDGMEALRARTAWAPLPA